MSETQLPKNRETRGWIAAERSADAAHMRSEVYHNAKVFARWRMSDYTLRNSKTIAAALTCYAVGRRP